MEKVPAGQRSHTEASVEPALGLNFPAAHPVHCDRPGVVPYVPATQGRHAARAVAPGAPTNFPIGQALHSATVLLVRAM